MTERRQILQVALGLLAGAAVTSGQPRNRVRIAGRQPLPKPFDGLEAITVEVTYPPGAASAAHRHPGFVLGYVIEGRFRFAVNGEPERTLGPGDVFFEPPDAVHSTSANPSETETARLLAIIIAEPGQEITTPA